jgi:hypothetical protein
MMMQTLFDLMSGMALKILRLPLWTIFLINSLFSGFSLSAKVCASPLATGISKTIALTGISTLRYY